MQEIAAEMYFFAHVNCISGGVDNICSNIGVFVNICEHSSQKKLSLYVFEASKMQEITNSHSNIYSNTEF